MGRTFQSHRLRPNEEKQPIGPSQLGSIVAAPVPPAPGIYGPVIEPGPRGLVIGSLLREFDRNGERLSEPRLDLVAFRDALELLGIGGSRLNCVAMLG